MIKLDQLRKVKHLLLNFFLTGDQKRYREITTRSFLYPINEFREEDIFIVGYPKSGNTWMQSIISGLQFGIDTQYLSDRLAQEIVPDVHSRPVYHRFGDVVCFKSHHLPKPEYRKVIYLVRDGRDAMVSYFHYHQNRGKHYSLEEMIKEERGLLPCAWHEHVDQWLSNPFSAEMITIRYEDLIKDPIPELKRICEFLGWEREEALLIRIMEGNSLAKMQEKAEKYGGIGNFAWQGSTGKKFFRKGKVGSYNEEMPKELLDHFLNKSRKTLERLGYEV